MGLIPGPGTKIPRATGRATKASPCNRDAAGALRPEAIARDGQTPAGEKTSDTCKQRAEAQTDVLQRTATVRRKEREAETKAGGEEVEKRTPRAGGNKDGGSPHGSSQGSANGVSRAGLRLAAQSCPTLRPCRLQPARLLCPWGFSGKNTGVGCHALLQGIFLTQALNPHLLHCRQILCH